MNRGSPTLVLLVATVALADNSTPQYLPFKMMSTAADPFRYYLDNRAAVPGGVTLAAVQTATNSAWSAWNGATCAAPKVVTGGFTSGTVPNPPNPYDLFNVTPVWVTSANDPEYTDLFGSDFVKAITIPVAYAGLLVSCDIYLNGVGVNWSTLPTTAEGYVDVESVMLHEQGHCLGIDHWNPQNAESVMVTAVQEGAQRRTLSAQDIASLCDRNPVQGGIGSPCLADGGCGGSADLKCITQPLAQGSARFCTVGCPLNTGFVCPLPLYCEPASFFNPTFGGACLRAVNTVTRVGSPCTDNSQCSSAIGLCQGEGVQPSGFKDWYEGYCYQGCGLGSPACPASSHCTNLAARTAPCQSANGCACLLSCRIGLADCRPGYACAASDTGGVCIPSCFTDADCGDPAVFQCRTCDGLCVERQNAGGQIGDLCQQPAQCGPGQLCTQLDPNKPVKQCTLGCGSGCGSCPTGSSCHPVGPGKELVCLRTCSAPGTCPGRRCASLPTGRACLPPCQQNADCPVGQDCQGGECFNPGQCGAFCDQLDAGKPIVVPKIDGGTTGGGNGGCGCATALDLQGLLALGLVAWARRRR